MEYENNLLNSPQNSEKSVEDERNCIVNAEDACSNVEPNSHLFVSLNVTNNLITQKNVEYYKNKSLLFYKCIELEKLEEITKVRKENYENSKEIYELSKKLMKGPKFAEIKQKYLESQYIILNLLREKKAWLLKDGEQKKKMYGDQQKLFMDNRKANQDLLKKHSSLWQKQEETRFEALHLEVKCKMMAQKVKEEKKRQKQFQDIQNQIRNAPIIKFTQAMVERKKALELTHSIKEAKLKEAEIVETFKRLESSIAEKQMQVFNQASSMENIGSAPFVSQRASTSTAAINDPPILYKKRDNGQSFMDVTKENLPGFAKRRFPSSVMSSPDQPKRKKINILRQIVVNNAATVTPPLPNKPIANETAVNVHEKYTLENCRRTKKVMEVTPTNHDLHTEFKVPEPSHVILQPSAPSPKKIVMKGAKRNNMPPILSSTAIVKGSQKCFSNADACFKTLENETKRKSIEERENKTGLNEPRKFTETFDVSRGTLGNGTKRKSTQERETQPGLNDSRKFAANFDVSRATLGNETKMKSLHEREKKPGRNDLRKYAANFDVSRETLGNETKMKSLQEREKQPGLNDSRKFAANFDASRATLGIEIKGKSIQEREKQPGLNDSRKFAANFDISRETLGNETKRKAIQERENQQGLNDSRKFAANFDVSRETLGNETKRKSIQEREKQPELNDSRKFTPNADVSREALEDETHYQSIMSDYEENIQDDVGSVYSHNFTDLSEEGATSDVGLSFKTEPAKLMLFNAAPPHQNDTKQLVPQKFNFFNSGQKNQNDTKQTSSFFTKRIF